MRHAEKPRIKGRREELSLTNPVPVRTLAWESVLPLNVGYRGLSENTDCHTSDCGHWFAMTVLLFVHFYFNDTDIQLCAYRLYTA